MLDYRAFLKLIRTGEARRHVNDVLLFPTPAIFRDIPEAYDDFRDSLTSLLGIPGRAVAVVGSAQLGFSLNPAHLGQKFRTESDIDVVIVSAAHFDQAWLELIEIEKDEWLNDGLTSARMRRCREDLFWGFIRLADLPRRVTLAREWLPALSRMSADPRFGPHDVNARLYRSWWQVEKSYTRHFEKLRTAPPEGPSEGKTEEENAE